MIALVEAFDIVTEQCLRLITVRKIRMSGLVVVTCHHFKVVTHLLVNEHVPKPIGSLKFALSTWLRGTDVMVTRNEAQANPQKNGYRHENCETDDGSVQYAPL